jgi:hypothetical protein
VAVTSDPVEQGLGYGLEIGRMEEGERGFTVTLELVVFGALAAAARFEVNVSDGIPHAYQHALEGAALEAPHEHARAQRTDLVARDVE